MDVVITSVLIFLARVADVSLGTIRTVAVINGRKYTALGLGFFEVLIWIVAVSAVVTQAFENPAYAIAYAAGFAAGNWVGVTIEAKLAVGHEVVRIFTRKPDPVTCALREAGFRVTRFEGTGRDGPIWLLFIKVERRKVRTVTRLARQADDSCFYTADPVRTVSVPVTLQSPSGWRSVFVRK